MKKYLLTIIALLLCCSCLFVGCGQKTEGDDVDSVMEEIYARTADITSADIMVYTRGMIPGYGASSGFEVYTAPPSPIDM